MTKLNKKEAENELIIYGKYSREKTEKHPFAANNEKVRKTLKDVLKEEGGSGKKFEEQCCFKLDDFDKDAQCKQARSGVDIAFCLASGNVLLSEAKFRVKSARKIDSEFKRRIKEKISGSIDILKEPPRILRLPSVVVLVAAGMKSAARSNFSRLGSGSAPLCYAMTETEFYKSFFE